MTTLPNLDDLMRLAREAERHKRPGPPSSYDDTVWERRYAEHKRAMSYFQDAASPAVVVGLVRVAMAAQKLIAANTEESLYADGVRDKLAKLLTRTANTLKGDPGELWNHDWSDLPKLVDELQAERDQALARAEGAEGERDGARAALVECRAKEARAVEHSTEMESRFYDEMTAKFRAQAKLAEAEALLRECRHYVCAVAADDRDDRWGHAYALTNRIDAALGRGVGEESEEARK